MKDFLFVDAVSGAPLGREKKGRERPSKWRVRRNALEFILISLVALIILLATWAFS